MPHVSSEGELLALAALVAPSFVDVSNEQYQEYLDQQQGIYIVDVEANAVVPTAIDEAMQFRQNVLRKHAREGSTLQNAIESYLPKGGDGKWFVDAVRTAVSIIRTNVVNIGVEAKKKNVKNPEWLLPADQNPFVLRAGDHRVEDMFPNGDFLLHTTSVEAAEAIINCGTLYSSRDGLEKGVVNPETRNNGTLAVSWSLNDVWAMPGTLYHINGFLASPHEVVTNKRQKLFVPTDAAYAEVQHMPVTSDEKKVQTTV